MGAKHCASPGIWLWIGGRPKAVALCCWMIDFSMQSETFAFPVARYHRLLLLLLLLVDLSLY